VGQLYHFQDKGGRAVALRPEMTPTLARMVAAHAGGLAKPIKWYCVQQFFRYERPQRGRGREFFQWNVDTIGSSEPAADAEVMAVAVDALRHLGLGPEQVVVRVNDRRFLERKLGSIGVEANVLAEVLGCIDKLERDPRVAARLEELLGREAAQQILSLCERMPLDQAEELAPLFEAAADFGLEPYLEPDFRIVRGLAYYTGPVWEVFDRAHKLRALAGGGRYDGLIQALGGPALPALGFGMGDAVLGELLRDQGLAPPSQSRVEMFVIPIGVEMLGAARRVVCRVRAQGMSADGPLGPLKLGKALRAADLAGARQAVLVGPEEWGEGCVRVKDLSSGDERTVRLEDLS